MKRVIVKSPQSLSLPRAGLATRPLSYLWALTGGVVPAFLLWGLITHGSPAVLIAEEYTRCIYLDIFGGFQTNKPHSECHWQAFRKLEVFPPELMQKFKEAL